MVLCFKKTINGTLKLMALLLIVIMCVYVIHSTRSNWWPSFVKTQPSAIDKVCRKYYYIYIYAYYLYILIIIQLHHILIINILNYKEILVSNFPNDFLK